MRRSLSFVTAGMFALAAALLWPSTSHAQRMLWGEDASQAGQPGVYTPFGALGPAERYGYPPADLFLWGNYAHSFWLTHEIDRQERYEKFGTRYTPDHPPLFNRLLQAIRPIDAH